MGTVSGYGDSERRFVKEPGSAGRTGAQAPSSGRSGIAPREEEALDLRGWGTYRIEALKMAASGHGFDGKIALTGARGEIKDRFEFTDIHALLDDNTSKPIMLDAFARLSQIEDFVDRPKRVTPKRVTRAIEQQQDDFDTMSMNGAGAERVRYTSYANQEDKAVFRNGSRLTLKEVETIVPCFTPGTTIATPRGEVLVEKLREGDRVITRDNGIQEIRWVGRRDMTGASLVQTPHLRPVLIRAGSLGNGLPERDMTVSPNHRILMSNVKTLSTFNETEVLASAKHLVGSGDIHMVDAMRVSYIHFMFDRHEVVLSNGAWTESFQPADESLKGIGQAQRTELFDLFPQLKSRPGLKAYSTARKTLSKEEAELLVE